MNKNRFFFIFYFLVVGSFILGITSLMRLRAQAERDAIFRENRIKIQPFGFSEEPLKITPEIKKEIELEMSAQLKDDKDPGVLFWWIVLGFAGFVAGSLIQSRYSEPTDVKKPE